MMVGCVKIEFVRYLCPYSEESADQCPFRHGGYLTWCTFVTVRGGVLICQNPKAIEAAEGGGE